MDPTRRRIVHVLTGSDESTARELIARQHQQSDGEVTIIDWSDRDPDWDVLLEAVFQADSITVW
jgi:hypothetical protein